MRICFAGAYLLGTKDGMILREGILEGKEHSVFTDLNHGWYSCLHLNIGALENPTCTERTCWRRADRCHPCFV